MTLIIYPEKMSKSQLQTIIIRILALITSLITPVAFADTNLASNSGFELTTANGCPTGITSCPINWTWEGGTNYTGISLTPHTGVNSFRFGEVYSNNPTQLAQSLSTISGAKYSVTFYLSNPYFSISSSYSNNFNVKINGLTLVNLNNITIPTFTLYSSSFLASANSLILMFTGYDWSPSGGFFLDDISVLRVGPGTIDTQASLHNSAQKLRSTFNGAAISTNFANMNTYDCNLFDTKGMCISAGGRYTTVDNPNSNSTSAVVVVGYKATPNIRIGGFLDQNVSNNTPNGIKISNKNPLMGIFAVWNQNADGLGVQVKLANAYQDKDVNTTRDVIGTSEAGSGATNLNTQSYVGELSYAFLTNQDKTTLRPYLALRQTTIKQDAYTETGVATPLTYAALKDRSTTALVGLKLNHALTPKATLTASLGIEQDLEHSVDQYSATSSSIANLTSENFNDSIKRTRPVASAGAYYAASKTQRISGNVFYQQLPFQSTGSTTAYFSYMIGL
jgi:hypothetical protein